MSEEQAIVTIERKDAFTIFTAENGVAPIIEKLRAHAANAPSNVVTLKGRKEIAAYAYKFATSKSLLESFGKELADEQKAIPKKIDAARKLLKDTCDELRDQVRKPLDDWEAAEEKRVSFHQNQIARLLSYTGSNPGFDSADLDELRAEVEAVTVGPEGEEFKAETERAKTDALAAIDHAIVDRNQREADRLELEELRRLKAEREAEEAKAAAAKAEADRLARAEQEAAERIRIAAENAVKAEQARAEAAAKAERDAAERRERELLAQAAESERKAAEAKRQAEETAARIEREAAAEKARELAETRKRAADKEHAAKINREIVAAFIEACAFINDGLSESTARAIVKQIALGNVPNCKITY